MCGYIGISGRLACTRIRLPRRRHQDVTKAILTVILQFSVVFSEVACNNQQNDARDGQRMQISSKIHQIMQNCTKTSLFSPRVHLRETGNGLKTTPTRRDAGEYDAQTVEKC